MPPLLRISRQVRQEELLIFYKNALFVATFASDLILNGEEKLKKDIAFRTNKRLGTLCLHNGQLTDPRYKMHVVSKSMTPLEYGPYSQHIM